MNKTIFMTGITLGILAVVLGAFGAHGLKKVLDVAALNNLKTGITYQMYHAFFLMILGGTNRLTANRKKWIYYLIVTGTVLFSGSIYLLATNEISSFNFKSIAFLTPIGGLLLISGWILLGYHIYKNFDKKK